MSTAVQDSLPASDPTAGNPAPRLLAAGIDVTEISKRPLPAEIWQAIERAALSGRNGSIRWELSCMLYEFSHRQLDEGKSSVEVTEWLCDRDVRGLLWSHPEIRCAVAETALPRSLLQYVNRVRRRLGWRLPGWWNQDDRAHSVSELCLAYHRRLSAGESVDSLQKVKFSAVAIELRRGILAQRSWISRAFRRFRIACVWTVALATITWVTLLIRLVTAVPGSTRDAIDRFDEANRQVAEEDRAWPIIRDADLALNIRRDPSYFKIQLAFAEGPAHADWVEAKAYLVRNRNVIDNLILASGKKGLGRIYRDNGNTAWYQSCGITGWQHEYRRNRSMFQRPLYQIVAYSTANDILTGAFRLAMVERDLPRACHLLAAQLRINRLLLESPDFTGVLWNVRYQSGIACERAMQLVDAEGTNLSADQLGDLLVAIRALRVATIADRANVDLVQIPELLDALYSEGPSGRITMAGLQSLREGVVVESRMVPLVQWLGDPRPKTTPRYTPPQDWTWLTGPVVAPLMLTRAELEAKLNEYLPANPSAQSANTPAAATDEADDELLRIASTDFLTIRNSPFLFAMGSSRVSVVWGPKAGDVGRAEVGAAVLRVALESHRIRTGAYPNALTELVPGELDELPMDPYGSGPLGYRLVEGRPLIYSVGLDGKDQTAAMEIEPGNPRQVDPGDLRLCPSDKPVKK